MAKKNRPEYVKPKSKTIHYHHDTKIIDEELKRGTHYDTSRGTGEYMGRSHSNGKLLFKGADDGKNIYFTRKQWNDEGNKSNRVNNEIMKASVKELDKPYTKATKGMVENKTRLIRLQTGRPATFIGTHYSMGIGIREDVASKSREWYPVGMFNDLHEQATEQEWEAAREKFKHLGL